MNHLGAWDKAIHNKWEKKTKISSYIICRKTKIMQYINLVTNKISTIKKNSNSAANDNYKSKKLDKGILKRTSWKIPLL